MVKFKCFECKCLFEKPESGIMITRKVKGEEQWFCSIACKVKKNPRHKFNAIRCEFDSIKFPSLLERSCYLRLKQMQKNGQITFFLRQVPFDIPGGFKHVIDYCIFTHENVIFIEAKGRDLPMGKMKRSQVEDLYNIKIHVVKNAGEIIEVVQVNG